MGAGTVRQVARCRYWREADARVIVGAWRGSGESAAAFARRHDVDPQRLLRWAKDLEGPRDLVRFHPVKLVHRGASAVLSAAPPTVEIVLVGGERVRVPPGVDPTELRRILDVVAGATAC